LPSLHTMRFAVKQAVQEWPRSDARAGLDPTTQISGFRKLKLTSCAPISGLLLKLGLVLCESRANQDPVFGRKTAPGLSALGSIEIEPVRLMEQEGCSRSASAAWLRRHHCGGPLLPDCIFNRVALRRHAFMFGCLRDRTPPGLAAFQALP